MHDLTFPEIELSVSQNPCLDDIPDPRDFQFSEIMGADLIIPGSFSLREKMTPPKNQGRRGTCTGFASTGIAEFHNAGEYNQPKLDLSEEYLFRRIKEIDVADYGYRGYGAYLRSGAKALCKFGTCLEKSAPYDGNDTESSWDSFNPTPAMTVEGETYRMASYLQLGRSKEGIKRALFTSQAPLLAGVTLHSSYRQAKTNGGLIPVPKAGEDVIGGHALVITGYTDKHIEFKNSWGATWGDKGYIHWPWEALEHVYSSIWSFVDLILNPHVLTKQAIEANKKLLLDHQVDAWEKAIKKGGIITASTLPNAILTKGDFIVFAARLGLL